MSEAGKVSSEPLGWIDAELSAMAEAGLQRVRHPRVGLQTATIHTGGRSLVNFASNDYLGLASDDSVCQAAERSIENCGFGAGASPLVTGYTDEHHALEAELAAFYNAERALVFGSGYSANLGTIQALVGPGDAVYGDKLNHASLIDGCRLSGAYFRTYRHADPDHLAYQLSRGQPARRRLIVTDSVFSMDGDTAPLPALVDLADRHDAMLLVDEAHATGVLGANGRGLAEQLGCESGISVHIGTLSKALGASGGFVVGRERLIEWLIHKARSYVYSTATPAVIAAAARAALQIVRREPDRRERLATEATWFREQLTQRGWSTGPSCTQIVPILVGEAEAAVALSSRLKSRGYWVPAIRPPTVPLGSSRLRISLTSAHTREQLQGLLDALGRPDHGE
jgi:8-amino-7-oxononanoate synthase